MSTGGRPLRQVQDDGAVLRRVGALRADDTSRFLASLGMTMTRREANSRARLLTPLESARHEGMQHPIHTRANRLVWASRPGRVCNRPPKRRRAAVEVCDAPCCQNAGGHEQHALASFVHGGAVEHLGLLFGQNTHRSRARAEAWPFQSLNEKSGEWRAQSGENPLFASIIRQARVLKIILLPCS